MQNNVLVSKAVGDPYQLFELPRTEHIFKQPNRVLIGHNRWATTGKVTRRNAHPFDLDTLVGVHNGTLKNKWKLENGSKFDVDSEALYHEIEDEGLERAIGKTEGAWTLTWWDKEAKTFNLLRNKERPMFFILSEDGKTMFGASESWMLTAVLGRDQYKTQAIQELPEDIHYSWEIPVNKSIMDMPELVKPRAKKVEGKKEVAVGHQSPKVTHLPMKQTSGGVGGSPNYLLAKQVSFRAIEVRKDSNGSEYMDLLDTEHPNFNVRLYFNKSEFIRNAVGKIIVGDITGMGWEKGVCYYKISPWSANVVGGLHIPKDTSGNEVSADDFEKKYHTCAWCSSSISYGEECHIFDDTCGVLCESCINDAEVNKYVKVM